MAVWARGWSSPVDDGLEVSRVRAKVAALSRKHIRTASEWSHRG